jgi:hypothetical protein
MQSFSIKIASMYAYWPSGLEIKFVTCNLRCTVFVLGIMDYGNPVFVLDLRKEKLTEGGTDGRRRQ